jgi:YVTN family beta-propeller protein
MSVHGWLRLLPFLLLVPQGNAQSTAQTPGADESQAPLRVTLPNGRLIEPVGEWTKLAPFPFAIAVRPDGSQAVIPSIGFPFALNVIDRPSSSARTVTRMPAAAREQADVETDTGVAYSQDGSRLYVATGDGGKVAIYDTKSWQRLQTIPLDGVLQGRKYTASFAGDLLLSSDGRWLYVIDQGNWRVVAIDAGTNRVVGSAPTGAYPFALALSPDQQRLYVTNTGLFGYKRVEGARAAGDASEGLKFPAFGYPSAAAREGGVVEGRRVPGLGSENSTRGSSLWTYGLRSPGQPTVRAMLRLGARVSEQPGRTVGGAAPTGVVADDGAVYVALAHDDAVVKVRADGTAVLQQTQLSPFAGKPFEDGRGRPLRGVMPSGLALHAGMVYVAEAGINAVAAVDAGSMKVEEQIPVGWNPNAVAISPDGASLLVVNAQGRGSGPNGGKLHDPANPSYVGALDYGSLSVIALAKLASPAALTATVIAANTAALGGPALLPRLKHCFLIIRENRTYDEMLGDLAGTNGDPQLARYGMQGWTGDAPSGPGVAVTPNLHAIAQQYGVSDNFFVDSDVSSDGHRWIVGMRPTPFFDTAWTADYGGRRKETANAAEPGRRAMFGGSDGPMPEDEPQFGSLWEHVAVAGKGILNYGEGLELEGSEEANGMLPEGQRLVLNAPLPLPVFESTDRLYPTFNLGIPDQVRVAEFERDFSLRLKRAAAGGRPIPALIVIRLPNDHGATPRPQDGYPYRASYMADNDLATGKIVSFLSKSAVWKDSAVFITEDDAQGGVDHVDAHRSVLVVASPYIGPGAIAHTHSDFGSITRAMNALLGLPPLSLEDALADDLRGLFSVAPTALNLTPYSVRPEDSGVFDPAKAKPAQPKTAAEKQALLDMDDPAEIQPEVEHTAAARRAMRRTKHQPKTENTDKD